MADAQPRWMLAPPGGPNGPSWSIIEIKTKRPVAMGIALESEARLFLAARELNQALAGAVDALRSYQYGNAAPSLAESVANHGADMLNKASGGS